MTVWQRRFLTIGALAASGRLATPAGVFAQDGGMVTIEILQRGRGPVAGVIRGGGGLGGASHVLEALVFPCPADCHKTSQACLRTAEDSALTCVTGACGTQIEAARTACIVRDDKCRAALEALKECATTCLDGHETAVTSCLDNLAACVDDCSDDGQ
jgi:hypothetical protein